jgi:glyoxylase-like metal-dependent hydrolase (beta-lactamase superfamily II)
LNPSEFTGPGTNTYIIGTASQRTLVDAGEFGHERYLRLLGKVLAAECGGACISQILVTHAHSDHIGGAAAVAARFGPRGAGAGGCVVRKVPWPHHDTGPIAPLGDGDLVHADSECTLRVLHTPGHAPDHCCFLLESEGALFSGDTILGAGA